jgi:hypothetical protein
MKRFAAIVFASLCSAGAFAQDGAKGAASPRVQAKQPPASTTPAAASGLNDKQRSRPKAPPAPKPQASDGMNFAAQEQSLKRQQDAQARRDAKLSKAMKTRQDTSKATAPNVR